MADTPLTILISRSKWNKIWLLLRELILTILFRLGKYTDIDSGKILGEADQEKTAKKITWQYDSKVVVRSDVLSCSAVTYWQDVQMGGGEVRTVHTYQLSTVRHASVCTNGATHLSIYGDDDKYLVEFSYVKYRRNRPRFESKSRHLPISRFVPGITLNLYGNVENAVGNYGHWMVDGVGLLYLALREYSIDEIDYFLVPVLRYDFQKESLLSVGIPEHKIIELPALSCYRFEYLICTSAPRGHSSGVIPGWLIDRYRDALLPAEPVPKGRRLYISRRDASSRKFVNEAEIVDLLETFDFDIIELSHYGFIEKIALFASAEIVVGLTGAGLTNLMFCAKNTHVVEISPTSFVTYFYSSMAGHLELDYRALIFESDSVLSNLNKYHGNLFLDPQLLKQALEECL